MYASSVKYNGSVFYIGEPISNSERNRYNHLGISTPEKMEESNDAFRLSYGVISRTRISKKAECSLNKVKLYKLNIFSVSK